MSCREIFMTAVVPDADAPKARAVLTGITEAREQHRYTKVCFMRRHDASPKSLDRLKELGKDARDPNAVRWQTLHQILLSQPYIIRECIDITSEVTNRRAGDNTPTAIPTGKPRTLRWDNIPEPNPSIPPFTTQRKMLEITDQKVEQALADLKFRPKSEAIMESYHWWLNNIEYKLTKTYPLPAIAGQGEAPLSSSQEVPDADSLTAVAPFWILHVGAEVEASPEPILSCQEQLVKVRQRLLGLFEFKSFDRRVFDTRDRDVGGGEEIATVASSRPRS